MKVWVDDVRPMPEDYDYHSLTASETIEILQTGKVTHISLDHDLGNDEDGTGYDIAKWIEENSYYGKLPPIVVSIHSANPVGVENMKAAIKAAKHYWKRSE